MTLDECVAVRGSSDFSKTGLDSNLYKNVPGGIHRAMPYTAIRRLMRYLKAGPKDALLDLGCGAGRVIFVAAQHPFSRIVGVEKNEKVYTLAKRNACTLRRCLTRPEVTHGDAASYRVPDDITVVFLFNPFGGQVLRSALERVLESYDRAPRRMRLVYANPREDGLVMSLGRFQKAGSLRISWRPGAACDLAQTMWFYDVEAQVGVSTVKKIEEGRPSF